MPHLPKPRTPRKPELMSPVGGWPQLKAALEAGADAVFFGLEDFHARAKVGFAYEELPEVMATLHARGVRGFTTFNVLVFDRELKKAELALERIANTGVDAIIVQDVGIARLAREVAPQLELHGSTQMSITSAEGAELAARWGCNRVVLGRELSLQDIERIANTTDVELETFVHGALCVSYSGQCFSSEAWGGRSANRGQCAQACRLPYDLIVDGKWHDLEEAKYLLSPGDLYALHQVPELTRMGVDCFKIEGRYKDAEYVALTTAAYRKAIDEAWAGQALSISKQEERDLEQVYSRGLGPWFMAGTNHQTVVKGRAPRHRGVKLGTVTKVGDKSVWVALEGEVKRGDGLVFDAANWRSIEEDEEGGSVYEIFDHHQQVEKADSGTVSGAVELRFGNRQIDFWRIKEGDWVWRSSDPALYGKVKPLLDALDPVYTRPLELKVSGSVGQSLVLEVLGEVLGDKPVTVSSPTPLQQAQKRALEPEMLREHLGKLGGTPFHLGNLTVALEGELFLPVSELNTLRRAAVEQLLEGRKVFEERFVGSRLDNVLRGQKNEKTGKREKDQSSSHALHILVRTPEQLEAALTLAPASITLDYLELYGLKPSVQKVKEAGIVCRVASPRILKPTEQNIQKFLLSLECEILVRSGGLLEGLVGGLLSKTDTPSLVGDFSLNAANVLSTQTYLEMGLARITPTHDLNAQQIVELAQWVGGERLEVVAYQHLPVFHTEHCVFCRFLSSGTDYTNCGHPCETHKISLKDRQGRMHPVMADVGCRNTVFGAEAQSATEHFPRWLGAGIVDFRLEFVHESAQDVLDVAQAWQAALNGEIDALTLEQRLNAVMPTTEGSLFVPLDFENLPQLSLI